MKQTTKNILGVGAIILLSSGVAGLTTYKLLQSNEAATETSFNEMFKQNPNVKLAAFDAVNAQPVDLTQAAENSLHAVVHIRSTQEAKTRTVQQAPDIFDFFFGDGRGQQRQVQTQPRVGFGSGVIISKDGYIVTNNHVIDGADEISVKLNDNREFKGRVIGTDPSTDLALVKIEGDDFPTIPVGDSEALKVGEWVLAVGNPFNLNSTVTAGIVSAKARTLGVYGIGGVESFIQTDAAINQGNSGGALVNAKGELVGINAVLSSPTGAYAGYGFAIPTSVMTKVVSDLKQYGTVQGSSFSREDSYEKNNPVCFSSSINISNRGTCRISNVTVGVGSGICAYRCPIQPGSKRIPISHTTIDLINDLILFLRSGNQTCVQCLVNNLQDILQRQIIKSSGQSRSLILCLVRNLDLIIITQVLNHLIQRCLHKTKLPCPPS